MICVYAATAFLMVFGCKIARNYLHSRNSTSTDVDKESTTVTAPYHKDRMDVTDIAPIEKMTPTRPPPVQVSSPIPRIHIILLRLSSRQQTGMTVLNSYSTLSVNQMRAKKTDPMARSILRSQTISTNELEATQTKLMTTRYTVES